MKKIILLLILPFIALMAIDFTMKPGSLEPTTTLIGEIKSSTFSQSKYLEPINIPIYNPNDSTHVLITPTNGKWNESVLNNLDYKHFYIAPGKYTDSIIYLRSSGTESARRTLSLYNPSNPNDTHPASLPDNEQANVKIYLNNASYWTLDRISNLDFGDTKYMMWIQNRSSHNIINRHHARNVYKGIYISAFNHYNTIQNCYLDTATHAGRVNDALGVGLHHGDISNAIIDSTKIINNDIRNYGDGIQLVRSFGSPNTIDFKGTVIDSNRIWVDGDIYTDGNGNYTPSGEYCVAENAIDVKAGSFDTNKPVLITNNIVWGYRHTDGSVMNYVAGKPFNISMADSRNLKYENNIVFDSEWGMFLANLSGTASSIKNNILYDIGNVTPTDKDVWVFATPSSTGVDTTNVPVSNNSIINTGISSGGGRAMYVSSNNDGIDINNNLFIDTINVHGDISRQNIDNHWYYNHSGAKLGGSKEENKDQTDPAMGDYPFKYERFTSNPKTKILKGVISTTDSPHYKNAGSSITTAVDANTK